MVCVEDPRKIVEKQLSDLEEETSKLEDRVTAALVICEEHMRDHHEKLKFMSNEAWAKNLRREIAKSLERRGCTLAMFWNGNRFTGRRWGVGWKEMMKCVIDGRSTDGETHTKRSQMKTTDETRPKSEKSSCSIYQWCCSRWCKNLSWCHRFNTLPCGGKTSSKNLECSETVEDLQNAVQRWCGQCPCRDTFLRDGEVATSPGTAREKIRR